MRLNHFVFMMTVLFLFSCGKEEIVQSASADEIKIKEKDTEKAKEKPKPAENLKPKEKPKEKPSSVWVYTDNGALQCEKPAMPLSTTKNMLMEAKIDVVNSQCAAITGMMVATMCGLKDTGIHMHEIPEKSLKKARGLGFEPITSLSHSGNRSYAVTECR